MKKILSFTDYYWPGYKAGGTIRAFMNQVDYLKDTFEFFIVTRDTDYTDTTPYPDVIPGKWNDLSPTVHVYYISARDHRVKTFYRLLREQPWDLVYIHLLFGLWYSFLPLILARLTGVRPVIIASHGVLGAGALGVKPGRKKVFLRLMKFFGLYRGTIFHSVTEHETADIRKHIGNRVKIAVARELPRKISTPPERERKTVGELKIVTIARISPEKNQLFALELLLQCRKEAIRYDLIGPVYDEAYWARCKTVIEAMPPNVKVAYRGSINSEMILRELEGYDLMLLPTTGENFGHTILESFMAGCPVLISDRTPWKGLEGYGIGRDIPLEEPERFRQAIEDFAAMDPGAHEQLSRNAVKFAMTYCENPEMLSENINLFNG